MTSSGAMTITHARGWLAAASVAALAVACGGGAKKPTLAKGEKRKVKIIDAGQIYDALNTTDCVKWPTPEVKRKSGTSGWGGYDPGAGEIGEVIAELPHCDGKTRVVLVAIGEHVVPVTSKGVADATAEELALLEAGEAGMLGLLGGDVYGGYGDVWGYGGIGLVGGGDDWGYGLGGDEYAGIGGGDAWGVEGGVVGGVVGGVASRFSVGETVEIVDEGQTYPSLNEVDGCVSWPDAKVRKQAGSAAWGSWSPANGQTGVIRHLVSHCDGTPLAIVEVDGHLVPIGESGLEY